MTQGTQTRRYAPPLSRPHRCRCICEGVHPTRTSPLGMHAPGCCVCAYAVVTAAPPGLQKLRLRTGRRTYHVVGMVPYSGVVFKRKHQPAFEKYLTQEVGTKFDPPIDFTIRFEVCLRLQPRPVRLHPRSSGAVAGLPQLRRTCARTHTPHTHTHRAGCIQYC